MIRTITKIGVAVVTLAMVATACGSSTASTSTKTSKTSGGASKTLTMWVSYSGEELTLIKQYATSFEKTHPGAKVDLTVLPDASLKQKVSTAIVAHDLPDVVEWYGGSFQLPEVQGGAFLNLKPMIQAHKSWTSDFLAGSFSNYTYKGGIYQVPVDSPVVELFYNKALLSKAGITSAPATFSALVRDISALKAKGITPIALDGQDGYPLQEWYTYLVMRDGGYNLLNQALAGKASWTSPAFLAAAKQLKTLISSGAFQSGFEGTAYNPAYALYYGGQAAMILSGSWIMTTLVTPPYKKILSETGFANFPTVTGGSGTLTQAQGGPNDALAVSSRAANPKLAEQLVRYLTSKTFATANTQQALDLTPNKIASSAMSGLAPLFSKLVSTIATYKHYELFWNEVMPPVQNTKETDLLNLLAVGSLSPTSMVKQFATYMKAHPAK